MNKKIRSIKVKIIMFLIPMLLFAFISLSLLGYKFASNSLEASNLNIMSEMTKTAASRADDQIKSEIKNLEVIASNPVISNENASLEEKIEILKPALKAIGQLNISISDKNGHSLDALGNKKEIKTTQSFMKSIKGENAITNPYVDPATNKKAIAYSVPIRDSANNIIGVITSTKDCKDFSKLNDETNFLKTGSSLIVDSNGNFIVAKDESLVSENKNITNMTSDKGSLNELNNIGKDMTTGSKSGIGKYTEDGKSKYMTYSPIGDTGLCIGITVEEKDLLGALSSLASVDIVVTVIMILLISSIIVGFTIKMVNRLLVAKTYVDTVARGDFYTSIDKKYIKAKDEISEICTSVGQAKESVGKMIKSVRDNANVVRDGSLSLSEIAEKLSTLTEEISASIGEVSISTNNQSHEFETITNKLSDFGDEINQVKKSVHSISNDVEIINAKSSKGVNDIEDLNEGIIGVNDSFERFAISIEYIQGDMKNVNEITNIINGISEQINLLAFNAAIEAASAGEAGRGFNVIASEIKKLSDKSRQSAQNIYTIINRLMNVINKLVEETQNMDGELEKQRNIVYNASSSFAEIAVLVGEIAPKVSNINNVFEDIICNKDLIVDTAYEISEEIKNTSNSLEQVTDSSVGLATLAEKVNCSSDILLDKADDLIAKVKQFRIDKVEYNEELDLNIEEVNRKECGKTSEELKDTKVLEAKIMEEARELPDHLKNSSDQEHIIDEPVGLDLLLEENLIDLDISPLENTETDDERMDFGWECAKVTEVKDYIKKKEQKEYEEENEEYKGYSII